MKTSTKDRLFLLDALRAFSLVSMVVFHFCYDLKYFNFVDWDTPNGSGFWQWRYTILGGFIFSMGMSMALAHQGGKSFPKLMKRLSILSACAALMTGISLFLFPQGWIYFGIIHFMVIASLITYLLLDKAWLSFALGLLFIICYLWSISDGSNGLYWFPFQYSSFFPIATEDYVPLFPWTGVALLGLSAGTFLTRHTVFMSRLSQIRLPSLLAVFITTISRHSLLLYLLHQPVLFGLLSLATLVGKKT